MGGERVILLETSELGESLFDTQVVEWLRQRGAEVERSDVVAFEGRGNESLSQGTIFVVDCSQINNECCEHIKRISAKFSDRPIVMLTKNQDIDFKIKCFQSGCDDVLVSPFEGRELVERVLALSRRERAFSTAKGDKSVILKIGDIQLDTQKVEVTRAGESIALTKKEFFLLEYFLRHPDKVVERSEILKDVWGYDFDPQTNLVDVHIKSLRKKLGMSSSDLGLKTIRGRGYLMDSQVRA